MGLKDCGKQNVFTQLNNMLSNWCIADGVGNIIISADLYLPPDPIEMVHRKIKQTYPHAVTAAPLNIRTTMLWSVATRTHTVRFEYASIYVTNGIANSREIGNALRGQACFSRDVSERMGAVFCDSLDVYDISGLFTLMAIIEDSLVVANTLGIKLYQAPPVQNGIVYINVNQMGEKGMTVQDAIWNRYFFFRRRYLSTQDLALLAALTIGVHALAPLDDGIRPIGSTFNSEGLRFVIWDDEFNEAPEIYPNLTAISVSSSAQCLASMMGEQTAYVRGFTRAATLLNGAISVEGTGDNARQRYFTSGLETLVVSVPKPRL